MERSTRAAFEVMCHHNVLAPPTVQHAPLAAPATLCWARGAPLMHLPNEICLPFGLVFAEKGDALHAAEIALSLGEWSHATGIVTAKDMCTCYMCMTHGHPWW
jgi:hypothetical protein